MEHERAVQSLGHEPLVVRYPEQLSGIDAIILPGGESTTMGKLLNRTGMMFPLRERILSGMPAWGTCAGMILMAKELENDPVRHLAVMDIRVRRNAYGSQIDSFSVERRVPLVSDHPVELVFIRAPYITGVGDGVQVLCEVDGHVVAAREGNMLVTSFHPELTNDLSFHAYFCAMISK